MILYFIFINAVSILLMYLHYKRSKTIYTAFFICNAPLLIANIFHFIVLYTRDPALISFEYLTVVLIFVVFFYIFSINKKSDFDFKKYESKYLLKSIEIIPVVFGLLCLMEFLYSLSAFDFVFSKITSDDFQNMYQTQPLNYFLRLICLIFSIYFFGKTNKVFSKDTVFAIICILPNALTFVKGIILIPIIASIICNCISHRRKFNLLVVLGLPILGFFIFFIVLSQELLMNHPYLSFRALWLNVTNTFVNYFISGPYAFNFNISNNLELFKTLPNVILCPINNFLRKFVDIPYIDPVTTIRVPILGGDSSTNVNTLYGLIYLHCGLFLGLGILFLMALFMNLLLNHVKRSNKHIYLALYCFFLGGFFFGFFNDYFIHTFWYYAIAIVILFDLVNSFLSNKSASNINEFYSLGRIE